MSVFRKRDSPKDREGKLRAALWIGSSHQIMRSEGSLVNAVGTDAIVGASAGDFLKGEAETPLAEEFIAAGAGFEIRTNSELILAAARDSFVPVDLRQGTIDLRMRFWVDPETRSQPPWPKPYLRGLDHLVFAGFDSGSSMLADLRTARVIGRFSPDMAADQTYWKTVIFSMLLSIVGASLGIAELHCGCVSKDGRALLLAGPSGTGKSSLSYALTQSGFGFLSDDRTFGFESRLYSQAQAVVATWPVAATGRSFSVVRI